MNKSGIKYPVKRIIIIDEVAVISAYILALLFRYGFDVKYWFELFDGLYVSFFFVVCMLQVIVYFGFDKRKTPIFLQDPAEILITVVKGKVLLLVMSLFYLYINQRGEESSRFVITAFFVLGIVIEYVLKLLYKRSYYKKNAHLYNCRTLEVNVPFESAEVILDKYKKGEYDEVLIHTEGATKDQLRNLIADLQDRNIRTYVALSALDYSVRSGIVTDIGDYAAIPVAVRPEKFVIFGIKYSIARTEEAVLHVIRNIKKLSGRYICFSNVHTSVMAREDKEYLAILNGAAFVFPDGSPIATLQQKEGIARAERVAGPDFMEKMFRDTADGKLSHFFYGSTQETLDELQKVLKKRFPNLNIKGMYSPPFRKMTDEEDQADIDRINESGADIIWIGLGAPKQEKWMKAHEGRIHGVMMGVGAGFNFHAGNIKRAPIWIQKIGLEWLYRLFQDPGRLFKRYVVTNTKFIMYLLLERLSK
nr:WecB/TagA/CpsF family glycosyltransferase [Butyrivibrio sp.]